jgi:hypothetical protein
LPTNVDAAGHDNPCFGTFPLLMIPIPRVGRLSRCGTFCLPKISVRPIRIDELSRTAKFEAGSSSIRHQSNLPDEIGANQ